MRASAIVGRIFAQRQPAVQLKVVHGNKVAVFVGDATGLRPVSELSAIFFGPPVAQVALRIELAALVLSKPWVNSCPITKPIAPKFTPSSIFLSKNGGWRIPAGNTISFFAGS